MDEDVKIYDIEKYVHSDSFANDYRFFEIRAEYAEAEIEGKVKNIRRDLLLKYGEGIIQEDSHRIKTADSTAEKMIRKKIDNIEKISDFLGWRLIVQRPKDIWLVSDLIDMYFEVYYTKDYINDPKPPENGGYTGAVHKKIRYQTTCGGKKVSVMVEIQITCIMFSAFWACEHSDNYKCKRENPHAVEDNQIVLGCINLIYEIIEQRRAFQENPEVVQDGSRISEHVKNIMEFEQKRNSI